MKKEILRKMCLFLAFLLLLVPAGCGSASKDTKAEVNIMLSGSVATIDPQQCADTNSGMVIGLLQSTLYTYDLNHKLVPGLAESREISEDALTVTYHLREGLLWSDGRPLTADDFVFAFQRLADPETKSNALYFITGCCVVKNALDVSNGKKPVSELGVSAPDHQTFVVELEEPCPYLDALLSSATFAPCNRTFAQSCGEDYASSPETLLCCGPFLLDRYEPLAMEIHMVPNPHYYNQEARAKTPGVNLQVVTDLQQAAMCYKTKALDVINVSGQITDLAEGSPELISYAMAGATYLYLNPKENEALGNLNIRTALARAIDRESIVKNVLRLGYASLKSVNPAGYYMETDGTDFSGDQDRYNDQMGYDPQRAAEFWAQGLKELGVSSLTIGISYMSGSGNLIEAIKMQLEENLPGLTIEMHPLTAKDATQKSASGTGYDMMLGGWVADYPDPTSFLVLFNSNEKRGGYQNPEYDKLLTDSGNEKDPDKRNEILHQCEDILMKDVACIPIYMMQQPHLVRSSVKGFSLTATSQVIAFGLTKEVEE